MSSYVTQIVDAGQKLAGTGFGISDEFWHKDRFYHASWIKRKIFAHDNGYRTFGNVNHNAIKSKLMDMEPEESEVSNALACFR